MAFRVVVKGCHWWAQEDFYSENSIDVTIYDSGILKVSLPGGQTIKSFNANSWRTVTSKVVPSKAKV